VISRLETGKLLTFFYSVYRYTDQKTLFIASFECLLTQSVGKVAKDDVERSTNQGAVLARIERQGALLARREEGGAQCASYKV
jgi:hypothetical protein